LESSDKKIMTNIHKNPAVTVDIVIFTVSDENLKVLLIERKSPPFENQWAIPGGFVDYNEDILTAAKRELEEETGVKDVYLQQLHVFGEPDRDPRGRVISIAHFALINSAKHSIKAQSDAKDVKWFSINDLPDLAFDHNIILNRTLRTLRKKLENTPIANKLLPEEFTISQLLKLYEVILGTKIDDGRFKCEILRMDFIEKTGPSTYSFKKDIKFSSRFY